MMRHEQGKVYVIANTHPQQMLLPDYFVATPLPKQTGKWSVCM